MPAEAQSKDFPAMYEREFGYVWKAALRLGVREVDCEDVVHDVFTTAFRQWASYDAARPVRPWLFGIAYRIVLDRHRKHQHRFEQPQATIEATDVKADAESAAATSQALRLAAGALAGLEIERRAVFVAHEIDGATMPEIAEALSIPLNTAYSRLRLARRDFNEAAARLQLGRP